MKHRLLLQLLRVFLAVSDFFVLFGAMMLIQLLRFSNDDAPLWGGENYSDSFFGALTYDNVCAFTALVWVIGMALYGGYSFSQINGGSAWYKSILNSGLLAMTALAIVNYLTRILFSRLVFILIIPAGVVFLTIYHYLFRRVMRAVRTQTRQFYRTALLIGEPDDTGLMASRMLATSKIGYLPACEIPFEDTREWFDKLLHLIEHHTVDSVFILGSLSGDADKVRQIRWAIEGRGVELVLDSSLTTIGGNRVHISALFNLPLIHVKIRQGWGVRFWVKRCLDFLFSACVLLVLSPIFALVALAIKCDSKGPVFFKQKRVGKDGEVFTIHKFRSMLPEAEEMKRELEREKSDEAHSASEVLFKLEDDPRVTRVGKFLRRTSLDEFPQFFDVLVGNMSVVGPRPHLAIELDKSTPDYKRRLLVRPGITGPWQVNGRSRLTEDEAKALDLDYVENWSLIGDFFCILSTIREMVKPRGAF